MSTLYHFIHSHGPVADLAYKTWHKIYDAKEKYRPMSARQTPKCGVYDITTLSIAISAICNSKCTFCLHPRLGSPKDVMPNDLFLDIMREWQRFGHNPDKFINLTPSGPPGEPLTDPGFAAKLDMMKAYGFKAFFVSNAISLQKYIDVIVGGGAVGQISISLPSFDEQIYREVYRVDKGAQVKKNLFAFLESNRAAGWPVDTTICFRNCEAPSEIIGHPEFAKLKEYFGDRCRTMFTTWWDDWSGQVPREEMERGWIKLRRPLNLKRVCAGAMEFSMRPTDRKIRLCGCRMITGVDDLIVGDLDDGFADAQRGAFTIQDGFKKGIRPKTCQDCGAYKQA